MRLDWNEHPEARDEFLDAHDRYLSLDDGRLADELVDEVDAATALILQWPDASPPYHGLPNEPMIRSRHLGKFPYRLIYIVHDGEVLVLAYAHEARMPGYWSHRLDN